MKKVFKGFGVCLLVLLLGYLIWEKSFPTVLQTAIGISKRQSKVIEYLLKEYVSFECDRVEKADMSNPILKDMDEGYEAYTVTDQIGKEYTLIIDQDDADLVCVLNAENILVYGLVDNDVLPSYFVDGKPWCEE